MFRDKKYNNGNIFSQRRGYDVDLIPIKLSFVLPNLPGIGFLPFLSKRNFSHSLFSIEKTKSRKFLQKSIKPKYTENIHDPNSENNNQKNKRSLSDDKRKSIRGMNLNNEFGIILSNFN